MSQSRTLPIDETTQRGAGALPLWIPSSSGTGRLIAERDWSRSPLGPLDTWPAALTRTARVCLESRFPFALAWGSARCQLYNDACISIFGKKHPSALGQDMRECWEQAWPVLGPYFEQAQAGRSAFVEDARLFLDRGEGIEEAFVTFSFSPLHEDDERAVAGVLFTVIETTASVLAERRAHLLRDVVAAGAGAASMRDALVRSMLVLDDAGYDLPFAVVYGMHPSGSVAELVARTQSAPAACRPERIDLTPATPSPWPFDDVLRSGRHRLAQLGQRFAKLDSGPYEEPATTAVILPISQAGAATPPALLVAAVSPRLVLDRDYMIFLERLAAALSTSVTGALSHEEQRQRAEQLSALDRAKTAFFSNVSHEFRTPLTLLAGPLADELAEHEQPLPPRRRERLATAHRNTQRLVKLVNMLLDFSRIEAGRTMARFRPTELGTLTSELAGMFRSTIERAGLKLHVDIAPLPAPLFVDREMWEKIVLNLMSNAFKHTFEGTIEVRLHAVATAVELSVIDTGVGIEAHELPHLFERFHRVGGARSRTREGRGIGLALVRELSRLHGGDVRVESQVGRGTTFTVMIPVGADHLPPEQVDLDASARIAGAEVAAYVQETAQWSSSQTVEVCAPHAGASQCRDLESRPKILLADDDADMRAYVAHLLADDYQVVAAADGQEALDRIAAHRPDLLLMDGMLPGLDGNGLLRAVRADPETRLLPVIVLSARAGEEAAVEGIEAGANDYLVKPFSARELLARVRTHIDLAQARKAWAAHLEQTNQELEAFSYSVSHDLRTPLRAIDGFSKALLSRKSEQLDDEAKRYLERVRRATARMSELIDELLNLARVSRAPLQRQTVSLTTLASRVASNLSELNPGRRVQCELAEGVQVHADARLLQIVLENLLENAWKFTANCNEARISVGRVAGTEPPTYYVADNGAGFNQSYAHRLFQPFQRLHLEQDYPGNGIGLAIVHRIIKRHGGSIWAEGHESRGATFYFTLTEQP
jgi:signal transduction histidine kinase